MARARAETKPVDLVELIEGADMVILKAYFDGPRQRVTSRLCTKSGDLVVEAKALAESVRDVYGSTPTKIAVVTGYRGYFEETPWPAGLSVSLDHLGGP